MRKQLCLLLVLALVGCGENEETTSPSTKLGPPENMKALSVNGSTVGLQWSPPGGELDSLGGYVVQIGNARDTLAKTILSYAADSLTPGEKTFTVYSRRVSGGLSDGAVIKWGPAARFDSPYVVSEYRTNVTTVESALDAGTATLDPAAMSINSTNAPRMDIYLFGGNGAVEEALQLQSTSRLASVWNATLFSTVTHASAGLDFYLASFPAASTFTLETIPVTDNTIYYIKVVGDGGSTNYARIHVHLRGGSFPNRAVEMKVSLQRTSGLLFASRQHAPGFAGLPLALIGHPGMRP